MYNEDIIRMVDDTHYDRVRRSGEAWNALAEFAKKFMDEYYPNDEAIRRSYNRYNTEYGHHDDIHRIDHGRYISQPRTNSGRFKRMRFGHEYNSETDKSEIGAMLAQTHGRNWMIEKAIKEASEFIEAATKDDDYEMFKEFCELCVLMKGVAEFIPAELEEQACEKAIEYYSKKAEHMRYSNPLLDEYARRNRMY